MIYVKDMGMSPKSWLDDECKQCIGILCTTGLISNLTGAQVAWRTVFVVEYLGPLIIHPVFYLTLPRPGPSALQTLTFALTMIHFGKRELETLFVHRFSSATMPFANVIRNSAYYWALSGVNMAYWVYLPSSSSSAAGESNPYITSLGLVLFVIGEVCNYRTHIILRDLRSAGGAERGIPQGLGFSLVTCPNYMFEFLAWIGVILVSWSLSTILFVGVASSVMAVWAKKKESKYRREFGSKYRRKRYVFLPGIW